MVKRSGPPAGAQAGAGTPKSTHTRQRILDAAAQVLNQKGFAGTRLSDIAALAQIQTPAIYYYFSSREDVIEGVIEAGQLAVTEHVRRAVGAVPESKPHLDRIIAGVSAHLEIILKLSQYASASMRNFGQLPDEMRARQMKPRREYAAFWRELFLMAERAGELDPSIDPAAAQGLVLGALSWAPEWWDERHGDLRLITITAQVLVRNGIARRVAVAEQPSP